jgi:hypothetical protein
LFRITFLFRVMIYSGWCVGRTAARLATVKMKSPVRTSDAHGVPAGEFSLTRTRTRRKPVPWPRVRDPAANLTGLDNINNINNIKYLIINKYA